MKKNDLKDAATNVTPSNTPRNVMASAALLGVLGASALIGGTSADAAPVEKGIKEHGKTVVVDKDTVISEKYQFIGRYIKGVTKSKTFGKGWTMFQNDKGTDIYRNNNPSASLKGKIGIVYENVGTYHGTQVDLKITVNDWEDYATNKDLNDIMYGKEYIGHYLKGVESVNQTWEYIDHKSGDAVTGLKGTFFTFTDIDANQIIRFDKRTTGNIAQMYTQDDTWVKYKDLGGILEVSNYENENANEDTDGRGTYASLTMMFDAPKITFDWAKDWGKGKDGSGNHDNEKLLSAGQFFGYTATKPARTELVSPYKNVHDTDEKDTTKNTLIAVDEQYSYEVEHAVPNETKDFYYKSYEFEDNLAAGLELKGEVTVLNEEGKDVTKYFTQKSSGQNVKLVATKEALASSAFYGNVYSFNFNVKIKPGADLSAFIKDYKITIPNTATVVVDGAIKESNQTSTYVPDTVKDAVVKYNIGKNDERTKDLIEVDEGKAHNYELDFRVGNEHMLTKLELKDDLEDVLDLKDVKIFKGKEDVTAQGKLAIDDEKESFIWTANKPMDFVDTKLTVKIGSVLKEEKDLSAYNREGVVKIPNIGSMVINGAQETKSNVVDITTTGVKPGAKKFNMQDGKQTLDKVTVPMGGAHAYDLDFKVQNTEKIDKLSFSDDLEDVLSFKEAKVFVDGQDVTDTGTFVNQKEGVKEAFTWEPKEPAKLAGKDVKIKVMAEVKRGQDLSAYLQKDGTILIPNKGKMTLNGSDKPKDNWETNRVDIDVPHIENNGVKYHSTPAGLLTTLVDVLGGGNHNYQLDFTVTNTQKITKLVLKDDLEDVLNLNKVTIMHGGKDITSEGTLVLDEEKESFTWEAKDPSLYIGEKLSVMVETTLKQQVDLSPYVNKEGKVEIPNVGQMILNNGTDPKDKVTTPKVDITTPGVKATALKFNLDADGAESTEEMKVKEKAEHAYRLKFQVPDTVKLNKLVLEDDLEDVLKGESATIMLGDKDITEQGKLTIDEKTSKVKWVAEKPGDFYGKELTMDIKVSLKPSMDLSPYVDKDGKVSIPNIGKMIVNEDETPTPEVDITTPGHENDAQKFNIDKDGKVLEGDVVVPDGGKHGYALDFHVTNKLDLTKLELVDDLEDVLVLKDAKVKLDGKDITKEGKLTLDKEKQRFSWVAKDPKKYVGQTLRVEIDSEVAHAADLSSYVDKNGVVVIPNKGHMILNDGEKVETPKVDILTPGLESGIIKYNVVKDGTITKRDSKDSPAVDTGDKADVEKDKGDKEGSKSETNVTINGGKVDATVDGEKVDVEEEATEEEVADEAAETTPKDDATMDDEDGNPIPVPTPDEESGEDKPATDEDGEKPSTDGEDDSATEEEEGEETPVVDEKQRAKLLDAAKTPMKERTDKGLTQKVVNLTPKDKHGYEIDFQVQNTDTVTSLILSDDLDDAFNLDDVKVFRDGKDVTKQGALKIDDKKESFTWTATKPEAFIGALLTVKIDATLKEGVDYKNNTYDNVIDMNNVAEMEVNGLVTESNPVVTTTTGDKVPNKKPTPDKGTPPTNPNNPTKPGNPSSGTDTGLVDKLVQTGSENKGWLLGGLATLLGASLVAFFQLRKRREEDEETEDDA